MCAERLQRRRTLGDRRQHGDLIFRTPKQAPNLGLCLAELDQPGHRTRHIRRRQSCSLIVLDDLLDDDLGFVQRSRPTSALISLSPATFAARSRRAPNRRG
jgi:hypothetical protein